MCKEKCKGAPGMECKACKETKAKAIQSLKTLLNKKPQVFNNIARIDMASLSPKERLVELQKIFMSGNAGKNEIAKIVASEANILPAVMTNRREIVLGPKSAIEEYENNSLAANAVSDGTNLVIPGIEGGNEPEDPDKADKDWTSILNASANVIGQVGGVLGMFFNQPQPTQEQIIITAPDTEKEAAEKRRRKTTNIIIGLVVGSALIGTAIYFVRKSKK